ncbi:hypothetical protein MW887_005550 [Aspergillus wentii]|nr:hypothetical protein MW887_005550 [Aspergillus wentii]
MALLWAFFPRTLPKPDANGAVEKKAHINRIRKAKGLDARNATGSNVEDLEAAIARLYEDLCSRPAHFLLEFIQNADENDYESDTIPTLKLTYRNRTLRIDCNETGFTAKNVEALCRIGRSTKVDSDDDSSHADKGIGFKSVFQAADTVWVASGAYTFKFDKHKPLGMIAPIWEAFPETRESAFCTSFLIQLAEDYDERGLIHDIQSIDSAAFLFLRRLKRIELAVHEESGLWEKKLWKDEEDEQLTTLREDDSPLRYIVTSHMVDMPREEKRPDQSKLVLAFPIESDALHPRISPQRVYSSVLPIRDYGLPFLLQADFLLSSSREDIESCKWNDALCEGLVDTFLAAVDGFTDALKYTWLRYLPLGQVSDSFKPHTDRIVHALADRPVLEAFDGSFYKPSSLKRVPERFMDGNNTPFTLGPQTKSKYLSPKYSREDYDALSQLGVEELSPAEFLEDLKHVFGEDAPALHAKSNEWHSQLAGALLTLSPEKNFSSAISSLMLIPLRKGKWASVRSGKQLLFEDATDFDIPPGVSHRFVDPDAATDLNRKLLFVYLGVTPCTRLKLCGLILKMHGDAAFNPKTVSRGQLVSHAKFLFETFDEQPWTPPIGSQLWFVDEKRHPRRGPELYIDGEGGGSSSPAARFLSNRDRFAFLHPDYLASVAEDRRQACLSFLSGSFGVSALPRLVSLGKSSFEISEDFTFLLQDHPSFDVLRLLRDHWSYYSQWIEDQPGQAGSGINCKAELRDRLAQIEVTCLNGETVPLKTTFSLSLDPELECLYELPTMPILHIEDAENESWQMLKVFGVTMEKNAELYISGLRAMVASQRGYPRHTLSYIYNQIQAGYTSSSKAALRTIFRESALIYTPPYNGTAGRWATVSELKGSNLLANLLELEYPTCTRLFQSITKPRKGEFKDLVDETQSITPSSSLTDIFTLLLVINKALSLQDQWPSSCEDHESLSERPIFPVGTAGQEGFELRSASDVGSCWFIEDDDNLSCMFQGQAPVLLFSMEQIKQLAVLLQAMQVESRKMSVCFTTESTPQGKVHLDAVYTHLIRSKAALIKSLLPDPNLQEKIYHSLRRVRVFKVPAVIRNLSLTYRAFKIHGLPQPSDFVARFEDSSVIFLTAKDIQASHVPLGLVDLLFEKCQLKETACKFLLRAILSRGSREQTQEFIAQHRLMIPEDEHTPRGLERANTFPLSASDHRMKVRDVPEYLDTDEEEVSEQFDEVTPSKVPAQVTTRAKEEESSRILTFDHDGTMNLPPLNPDESEKELDGAAFAAESLTSALLQDRLEAYRPEKHWTSKKRERVGFPSFTKEAGCSPFTLSSCSHQMTSFLVQLGYKSAERWRENPPVYHIEVVAAEDGTHSPFPWSLEQMEKSWKLSLVHSGIASSEGVVILALVSNIKSNARLRLFVDPWYWYVLGYLRLHDGRSLQLSDDPYSSSSLVMRNSLSKVGTRMSQYGRRSSIGLSSGSTQNTVQNADRRSSIGMPSGSTQNTVQNTGRRSSAGLSSGSTQNTVQNTVPGLNCSGFLRGRKTYSYRPLDGESIRLFSLLPGQEGDDIWGFVSHTTLESAGPYRALSYAWGDHGTPYAIRTEKGLLPITVSLDAALRRLRDKRHSVLLWVDAICINQADEEEKANQVRLMPSIYRSACSVVAYLGEGDEQSDLVLQAKSGDPAHSAGAAMDGFFAREWFQRAWVVQEIVAARTLWMVCGKQIIGWTDLMQAIKATDSPISNWGHIATLAAHRDWEAHSHRWPLIHLLGSLSGHVQSTLTRDRLFSMLGFSLDGGDVAFEPDYAAPLEDVVIAYAHKFVDQGRVLKLLSHAGLGTQPTRFPSWVPDWTIPQRPSLSESSGLGILCAASRVSSPMADIGRTRDELLIRGVVVDTITCVGKYPNTLDSMACYLDEVDQIVDSVCGDSDTASHLKWKVPIAGADFPEEIASSPFNLHPSYQTLRHLLADNCADEITQTRNTPIHHIQCPSTNAADNQKQNALLECQDYINALQVLHGWNFLVTENRYLGIGSTPHIGDRVVVFHGAKVPFLLRPSEERPGAYRAVGECYIHGIMGGEAWGEEEDVFLH